MDNEREVRILYTNYRGETSLRRVIPEKIYFAASERSTGSHLAL